MANVISFGDANAGFQAGIVNGSVNTTFHLPPEQGEAPPPPSILIPSSFRRDKDFVERGTTLDHVRKICAAPDSRAALVGLGGVGKSQLASNAARFEQSYREIADYVKVSGRLNPRANIFKLVHEWLYNSKERWLLVVDNVDDDRFLDDSQANGQGLPTDDSRTASRPLRTYLPRCERGSILITTRNKEVALRLVERRDIVSVEPMDEEQALALFRKKLEVQGVNSDVAELAAALEYMPLAIVQAAAYISHRQPRCSVAKYLEEFKKSERKRLSLLTHDDGQLRRDWEAKNSIVVTWQMSFDHIQQTRPSAADQLSLMSFFDRQGIPEALVRSRREHGDTQRGQRAYDDDNWDSGEEDDNVSQYSAGDDAFEDDVLTLRNFCFIAVDANGTSFEMHALVQLATRMWLAANSKLEQWRQQFISNLCAEFPTGEYENWAACQALFAHARSAVEQQPKAKSSLAEWATLLYRAAWYAEKMGNVTDAATLAEKSMKARKKVLGQEHKDTLWSIAIVGLAYKLGGRWNVAEELEVQVMETRKTKLGADHPDTLTSMANLASTYWNQGRWDDAEKLGVQVMETRKTKLGADHPDTLTTMNNLAFTWKDRGRHIEAINLMRDCVQLRQQMLRADHPDMVSSSATLGQWEAEQAVAD